MKKGLRILIPLAAGCAVLLVSLYLGASSATPTAFSYSEMKPVLSHNESFTSNHLYYRRVLERSFHTDLLTQEGDLWTDVSGFSDGHPGKFEKGYHLYALRLQADSAKDTEYFFGLETNWWADLVAMQHEVHESGHSRLVPIERLDKLGLHFRMTVPANTQVTALIRFRLRGPSLTQLAYVTRSENSYDTEHRPMMVGLYLGVAFLMLLYNVALFVLVRERTYLYFILTIVVGTGLFMDEIGFLEFAGLNSLTGLHVLSWLCWVTLAAGLMVTRFVGLRPSSHRSLRLLGYVLALMMSSWALGVAVGGEFLGLATRVLHLCAVSGLGVVVFLAWRRREPLMGVLLVAMSLAALTVIWVPMMRLGFLPNLIGLEYFHFFSVAVAQAVICSLLPLRFRSEQSTGHALGQDLSKQKTQLLELSNHLVTVNRTLRRLEQEEVETRVAISETQIARMDTEKKLRNAHQQLRQLEAHVSLGRLVAGVAHDIANPATHISGCVQAFTRMIQEMSSQSELPQELRGTVDGLRMSCGFMGEASHEIVRINQGLAKYGRTDDGVVSGVRIADLADQVLCVVAARIGSHSLHFELENLPAISCKPGEISQLLANLLLNAVDAVESVGPAPGKIQLQAAPALEGTRAGILLMVDDSGPGIPEVLERMGPRPFVTTRDPTRWLGIGLSIVKRILDEHGGQLHFTNSTQLGGASVRVWLPRE